MNFYIAAKYHLFFYIIYILRTNSAELVSEITEMVLSFIKMTYENKSNLGKLVVRMI